MPEDVSIVGFDDIPEAEFFLPPLTTVRQEFNEMGRLALHCLLDGIGAPDTIDDPVDRARHADRARERRAA